MDFEERVERVYEATDAALRAVYGEQEPAHLGTLLRWNLGGPDPLDGVSTYWNPEGHWHFVGFGMTERDEKQQGTSPQISGWGFELTYRLRAPEAIRAQGAIALESRDRAALLEVTRAAPRWPVVLLNDLARYVISNRRGFRHADFVERPGAGVGERLGLVEDPQLAPVESVNGRWIWLQAVSLSTSEIERLKADDFEAFLTEYRETNPLFVSHEPPRE